MAFTLYFVRHAQSVSNATNSSVEHDDLSEEGTMQAINLVQRLRPIHFDEILVSPKRRAIKTILPYLNYAHNIAKVCTDASEACWQEDRTQDNKHTDRYGSTLSIDQEFEKLIRTDRWVRLPPPHETYAEGLTRTRRLASSLIGLYGDRDVSVLLAGHYHAGSRLIEVLVGEDPVGRYRHSNTGLTKLTQNDNGFFSIDFLNAT